MSHLAFSRIALTAAIALSLTACSGGFGDGSSSSNSTTETETTTTENTTETGTSTEAAKAAFLEMSASSYQLMSADNAKPVEISAVVKDKDNIILDDVEVKITVDGNASITKTLMGVVNTAQLSPGLNHPENRSLNVKAVTMDGSALEQMINIDVIGTEVLVDGPDSIGINKPNVYTIKLKDSNGSGLPGHTVDISTTKTDIAPVTGTSFVTNTGGELKFTLTAAQSGEETITASALGAISSKTVAISGDAFSLTSENLEIPVNTAETISLELLKDGSPRTGIAMNLSATRGAIQPNTVTTDNQGKASFTISSATSGITEITASASDDGHTTSIEREFVATTPKYLNIQTDKTLITPLGSATIIATVRDVDDNPVKNKVVTFNLNDAVNGTLSSNKATTDSLGRATIVYTAGDASSAFDGVVITSTLDSYPSVSNDIVKLTVGGEALRLVLGSKNKVESEGVTYKSPYGVIVTDSSGNPVENKKVEFSLRTVNYIKSMYGCVEGGGWTPLIGTEINNVPALVPYRGKSCPSEDANGNGKLDQAGSVNEDVNGNGLLDPTNTATVVASGMTDANGLVQVEVIYPQSEALWSEVELTASVNVNGTESIEKARFVLGIAAEDANDCDTLPPNYYVNRNAGVNALTDGMGKYGANQVCSNED